MTEATLLNTVRAHGLRVSDARRAVLARLLASDEPLTADEIAGGADVASVYRNLSALEAIGVVRHVHVGHGPGRYALRNRFAAWATCECCGRLTPLTSDAVRQLQAVVLACAGYAAQFDHFPIVGRCADCN